MIDLIDNTRMLNTMDLIKVSKKDGEFSIQSQRLLKQVQFVGKLTSQHYVAIENVEWEGLTEKTLFTSEDISSDALDVFSNEYGFRIVKVDFLKPNIYLFTSVTEDIITNTFKKYCENLLL